VTLGFQVVNGWNNLRDNNSGKTIGATSAIDLGFGTWYLNYYAGPEAAGTNTGWHHLIDTTLSVSPTDKLSAYLNYDYDQDRSGGPLAVWQGFASALHYQANDRWGFTGRGEWFQDRNGFSTGTPQIISEVTFTGEYKMAEGLLTRAEYRHDWSNQAFFERGLLGANVFSKKQDTFTVGIVAFFGPMR
jgi:Putative beta-barrel porin-2, OmpL-like. bbp2